jgi:hypothetical protein
MKIKINILILKVSNNNGMETSQMIYLGFFFLTLARQALYQVSHTLSQTSPLVQDRP